MLKLHPEQQSAIDQTYQYWQQTHSQSAMSSRQNPTPQASENTRKFLWNAKPRFGKTLAAYKLAQKIDAKRILIITNRPAISDAWASDFFAHIAPETNHIFASAKPPKTTKPPKAVAPTPKTLASSSKSNPRPASHIYSRSELIENPDLLACPLIYFISLQDIKGKDLSSADFKAKNQWIFDVEKPWDLLIIDEGHEGIKTSKASAVLSSLNADFTLYLSGTPFRALADQDFSADQIFNWTYLDEQKTYQDRPRLDFRVCRLPKSISAAQQSSPSAAPQPQPDDAVQSWLDYAAQIFRSQPELRHTFWLLSKVSDCKTLQAALTKHPFFHDYKVILAAGKLTKTSNPQDSPVDVLESDAGEYSSQKVLSAVRNTIGGHPDQTKTITLSCGRLTTGITIPEWSAVFMLYSSSDLSRLSSAQYLQAAFRAQNPAPGKSEAYIFDFAPDRALTVLQEYAERLCNLPPATALPKLLQYLDVNLLDGNARPESLSAPEIIELPRQIIAQEIVDGGFIASNKLFNIQNIFHASPAACKVINKLSALHKNRLEKSPRPLPTPLTKLNSSGQIIATLADEKVARRRKKREEDDYRDKLRGFSRTIPMLLHLCGEPDFTFSDLADKIPDQIFQNLTGLTKDDFALLRREQYFNETNCNLAIREFMRREKDLSTYFLPTSAQNIFDFIPLQYGARVFTPKSTAEKLVQRLIPARPELFRSRDTKFFDSAAKSGLLLTLIVKELYRNLRPDFPSDHDCLLHILTHQIYSWSPDEISHRATLSTVLSFIHHDSVHFSAAEITKINQHFLQFNPLSEQGGINLSDIQLKINQTWEKNMKFDVIISNPPYQQGRRQIYADFYRLAVDLDPELLCMVFPQGWQKPHNRNGLGQLNCAKYKRDPHIAIIDNYDQKSAEKLFPNIGTGGVNIILRDRNFYNHGSLPQLIAGEKAAPLVLPLDANEVIKPAELIPLIEKFRYLPKVESLGSSRKPYGFYADPLRNPGKYNLELHETAQSSDDVRLFGLLSDSSRGYRYISRASLPKVSPLIDRYKLFVPKAWGNMATNIGLGGSYSNICVASPGDVCSETFIEFGPFASQEETIKVAKYFMTKFFRTLLFLAKDTQNTAKDKYRYIPLPDFSDTIWHSKIPELDEKLFKLYDIPPVTRDFILQNVQPRSEANIEIL